MVLVQRIKSSLIIGTVRNIGRQNQVSDVENHTQTSRVGEKVSISDFYYVFIEFQKMLGLVNI